LSFVEGVKNGPSHEDMPTVVEKILDSVSTVLDINQSTLSGAIDILVVDQPDGSLRSTPFHVRFGKLELLRPRDKLVHIAINGRAAGLTMRIGSSGECYFVDEEAIASLAGEESDGGSSAAEDASSQFSSPGIGPDADGAQLPPRLDLPGSAQDSFAPLPPKPSSRSRSLREWAWGGLPSKSRRNRGGSALGREVTLEQLESLLNEELNIEKELASQAVEPSTVDVSADIPTDQPSALSVRVVRLELRAASSHAIALSLRADSRAVVACKPSFATLAHAVDVAKAAAAASPDASLATLSPEPMPSQGAAASPPPSTPAAPSQRATLELALPSGLASGSMSALPLAPPPTPLRPLELPTAPPADALVSTAAAAVARQAADAAAVAAAAEPAAAVAVAFSLCGAALEALATSPAHASTDSSALRALPYAPPFAAAFEAARIEQGQFVTAPGRLCADPDLRVRVRAHILPWAEAAPLLAALAAFGELPRDAELAAAAPLPPHCAHEHGGQREEAAGGGAQSRPPSAASARGSSSGPHTPERGSGWRWFGWGANSTSAAGLAPDTSAAAAAHAAEQSARGARGLFGSEGAAAAGSSLAASSSAQGLGGGPGAQHATSTSGAAGAAGAAHSPTVHRGRVSASPQGGGESGGANGAVRKCIRLTSEQLAALRLREGANAITFTVHSSLQGTQVVSASIHRWSSHSKIVISDVDGTITKSDVLGHVMPRVGIDWSHSGVTAFYSRLRQNGYHLLYLTSRGIGQSLSTREYLTGVQQGETTLPLGPIFMSPTRLIESFTREVIWRNPEEFKRACLEDIRSLFPAHFNPYYAGFGNRTSDETAYRAVGVPESRILLINPQVRAQRRGRSGVG
jgi:phosphatidate phosphatase LPIN